MDRFKSRVYHLLFVISVLMPGLAWSGEQAQELVEKMSASAKSLNYEGYFTFERDGRSSSFFIAHQVKSDTEHQRLVFMDGMPREIISDGHSFQCLHPGDKKSSAIVSNGLDLVLGFNKPPAEIWQYYDAVIKGEERVAGRETTRIFMKPLDQHRYPHVFNVDNETGLMVKMLVLDQRGKPLERFHFVSLTFDDVSEKDLAPGIDHYVVVEHDAEKVETDSKQKKWQLAWIPAGFEAESVVMKAWNPKRHEEAFMYSDGLAAFSVFIEPSDSSSQVTESTQIGSTSAVSHYFSSSDEAYVVTVIGEIPMITARQIASAVRGEP